MSNDKHRPLIFLVRHQDKIVSLNQPPEGIEVKPSKMSWHFKKQPPERIGQFNKNFMTQEPPQGVIGVFDPSDFFQLQHMLECHKWHLEDISAKQHQPKS